MVFEAGFDVGLDVSERFMAFRRSVPAPVTLPSVTNTNSRNTTRR